MYFAKLFRSSQGTPVLQGRTRLIVFSGTHFDFSIILALSACFLIRSRLFHFDISNGIGVIELFHIIDSPFMYHSLLQPQDFVLY